ncbi:NADH dehydrogenase ubiquinone 1 beta subcomplex subunit 6 [Echinococcus multilocularis]|uniref:NADH dehydrogenase ubiquinone 1 beta subcomplex subunit 6 n=1 Tax=Echinococcus multilocularis TaxID=6211 RepID=A0A068Y8P7_ECHMU|nr:NADH dehydrogenase ubiquinone 1 beta subcomplex subunit 6 [Echinococcus multilocularis]
MPFTKLDDAIIEMQKQLYKEEYMKELRMRRGGKFYPFNIEPMPTERERLIKPMTDSERASRKQWLADQKLSPREPVDVPEFTRKNIFRRAYCKFFDGLAGIFRPVLGQKYTPVLRKALPLALIPYLAVCTFWYQVKYSPRTWETGFKGFRIERLRRPAVYPGQPDFPNSPKLEHHFADEGFSDRKIFLGDKLVTSGR